MQKLKDLISNR